MYTINGVSVGHESSQNKTKHTKILISQLVGLFKGLKLCYQCFANEFILQNESVCRNQPLEENGPIAVAKKKKKKQVYSNCTSLSALMAARFSRDPMTSKLVFEKKPKQ